MILSEELFPLLYIFNTKDLVVNNKITNFAI